MKITKVLKFIANHPLNRDQKIKSIIRFVKWQIGSRLIQGSVVVDWINGSKFLVRRGETGLTGNIYTGLHEFTDMSYLLHVLRSEDLFVDIGANVGSYSILACSAVGAEGIAFEPVPSTFDKLIDNMRVNRIEGRVECINEGVGATRGELKFTSGKDTMNHALAEGEHCGEAIAVKVCTLDDKLTNRSPGIIKIDVEGFETPVLDGAASILQSKNLHSVIMELNGSGEHYGFDENEILKRMGEYGFETYSYDPFTRKLKSLEGKNQSSGNTIFIRNKKLVEERLENSKSFTVLGKQV
ncbi:MAG: FkbM family methyltransferase [Verrucomicrobiota bacterium]